MGWMKGDGNGAGGMALPVALQTSCEKFSYNLQKRNGA
jgi:hypothetical protein